MNRLTKAAVVALALSTTAVPMLAEAQSRHEYRQDRRDDRRDYREERREDRQDYRRDRREDRWDRSNRDWWRGRPEFRGYNGPRRGYWYAPGHGYYRVEPRYYGYRWTRGAYLPPAYRHYYVNDYGYYGLRPPPPGYRYVYAGGDILMIAVASGLIASVLSNVF